MSGRRTRGTIAVTYFNIGNTMTVQCGTTGLS